MTLGSWAVCELLQAQVDLNGDAQIWKASYADTIIVSMQYLYDYVVKKILRDFIRLNM